MNYDCGSGSNWRVFFEDESPNEYDVCSDHLPVLLGMLFDRRYQKPECSLQGIPVRTLPGGLDGSRCCYKLQPTVTPTTVTIRRTP